jgi:hypothetical protein
MFKRFSLRPLLVFILSLLVLLLFVSLNSGTRDQVVVRRVAGCFFSALVFLTLFIRPENRRAVYYSKNFPPMALVFFALFIVFEAIRPGWAWVCPNVFPISGSGKFPVHRYLVSMRGWLFFFALFYAIWIFLKRKQHAYILLAIFAWGGFLLSVNALPFLSRRLGEIHYYTRSGQGFFFHPWFYTLHPWVNRYILARTTYSNCIGDVVAMGLFPALGLALYAYRLCREKLRLVGHNPEVDSGRVVRTIGSGLLYLLMALTMAAAIFLFFSRGTILCFFAALLFFLSAYVLKSLSRRSAAVALAVIFALFMFLAWAGQLPKIVNELMTLQKERVDRGSASVNWEGAQRALRIYRAFPIWGVGTKGYQVVSEDFATPGTSEDDIYFLARFESMCHYLHLLAEEGIGAYLYFLFILGYLIDLLIGLVRVRGRFQFIAALSFAGAPLLVFTHAAINHLMQQFSLQALVYISMAASLAVLRKDYER